MRREIDKSSNLIFDKYNLATKIFFILFWVGATYNFPIQEVTKEEIVLLTNIIGFALDICLLILALWLIKSKVDWILLISFLLISFYSTIIANDNGLVAYLNGIRQYFCYICMLPILRYFLSNKKRMPEFVKKFDKTLFVFLCIQFPCMTYQCILYGAFDQVGGSLGWMMSGVISMLLYLISFYLMQKHWDNNLNYIANLRKNWILIFLLLPSFMNETKVSFIYLALYFILLIKIDKMYLTRLLMLSPIMIIIFTAGVSLYITFVDNDKNYVNTSDALEFYLTGDDAALNLIEILVDQGDEVLQGEDQSDFARGLKFAAIPLIYEFEDTSVLSGFGVGQYKGGNIVKKTKFAKDYEWLLKGTIMEGERWIIELGILGIIWVIVFWISVFKTSKFKQKNLELRILLVLSIILIQLYNNFFLIQPAYIIFIFFVMTSYKNFEIQEKNLALN